MAISNEELMGKLVRTGMIMRHIDGHGPRCHKGHHGPHHGHGPCEGHHGHGPGKMEHGFGHGHGPKGGCHRGQARVLAAISMKEGITQKELAFVLGIRPQTLGEMLQRLEEREMIVRTKSETDGRAIEVSLTDEGRKRAEAIIERRKLAAADVLAVLTDDEKDQLAAILDKLAGELDKRRPHHHCKKEAEEAGDEQE